MGPWARALIEISLDDIIYQDSSLDDIRFQEQGYRPVFFPRSLKPAVPTGFNS